MQHSHQTNLFNSENQTKTFSYTRFPVNKITVEKIFKIMRKSLFNYSFYSHSEIGKFQGVTVGRSGRIFGGVNLWIVVHPERPGCDQSERCSTPVWTVLLFVGFWPGWTFRGVGLSLGLQLFWVCAGLAFGVSGSCTWVFFLLRPIWPVCYTGLISVGLFSGKLQVLLGWPD
jgi:hypothetical protein